MASAQFAAARASQRARLIRLIHVARRDLRMEDDAYRAIVADKAAGKASSADCSVAELEKILAHLKAAGFKVRKPKSVKPAEHRRLDTSAEARKVRALWLLLHELGAVRDTSEAALAGYVRRMAGIDDLHWADGNAMLKLIESLKKWAMRYLPLKLDELWSALRATGRTDLENERTAVAFAFHRNTFDPCLEAYQACRKALGPTAARKEEPSCH